MTTTKRAADVWHHDPDDDLTAGVLRREEVRVSWPELASALDASTPSDILAIAYPEALEPAAEPDEEPVVCVHRHFTVVVPHPIVWAISALVGVALGMALQFNVLQGVMP